LIFTISLSVFLGDFTFLKGSEAIYKRLIVVILYPPFAILSIFHAHFVRRNIESLSRKIFPEKRDECYHIYGCEAMTSGHDLGTQGSEIIWK
jgi:hypothetical protein